MDKFFDRVDQWLSKVNATGVAMEEWAGDSPSRNGCLFFITMAVLLFLMYLGVVLLSSIG